VGSVKDTLITLALAAAVAGSPCAPAQSIEPRTYANAPVGMNFLIAGYAYSEGAVTFDPTVPLENGRTRYQSFPLAYVRSLDLGGNAGSIGLVLPFAHLEGTATLADAGDEVERKVSGLADPALRLAVNFLGAPALSAADFAAYRQDLIVGASVVITAPFGQYDPNRLVNLGTNRWSVKPGLGLSKALGAWTVELDGGVTWYSTNHDFFGGNTRAQDPLYSVQANFIHQFPAGVWGAFGAAYYAGGGTSVNGVAKNDRQQGARAGLTLSLPVDRHHSIKLTAQSGLYARTGTSFKALGVAWEYRWGGGF